VDEVELCRRRAAKELEGLSPREIERVLREAVERAEKETGYKFPRFKGKMVKPRLLRKAQ
jgi:hypothetical protein